MREHQHARRYGARQRYSRNSAAQKTYLRARSKARGAQYARQRACQRCCARRLCAQHNMVSLTRLLTLRARQRRAV